MVLADAILYVKYINNKDLSYSTGDYMQYLVTTVMEKNLEITYMCVCV